MINLISAKTEKKHIRNTIKSFIEELNKSHKFNNIHVWARIEGSDEPEPCEQTVEEKLEWDKNYCAFIVEPQWPVYTLIRHDGYMEDVFMSDEDKDRFWFQLRKHIVELFNNEDLIIRVYPLCSEIEVYRR